MKPQIRLATGAAALGAAAGAMVLGASGAPAGTATAAQAQKVSHRGVGQVHIGMRFSKARDLGLVGPREEGCEFNTSIDAAQLRAPLEGFVEFDRASPSRIRRISITGGSARARGVRVGDPLSKVQNRFPGAKVRNVTQLGGFTFVRVPRSAGGKFDFLLKNGPKQRVRSIEIRRFAVCD